MCWVGMFKRRTSIVNKRKKERGRGGKEERRRGGEEERRRGGEEERRRGEEEERRKGGGGGSAKYQLQFRVGALKF